MDVIARLYEVEEKNTTAYQGDFELDAQALREAAKKPDKEDRCFLDEPTARHMAG